MLALTPAELKKIEAPPSQRILLYIRYAVAKYHSVEGARCEVRRREISHAAERVERERKRQLQDARMNVFNTHLVARGYPRTMVVFDNQRCFCYASREFATFCKDVGLMNTEEALRIIRRWVRKEVEEMPDPFPPAFWYQIFGWYRKSCFIGAERLKIFSALTMPVFCGFPITDHLIRLFCMTKREGEWAILVVDDKGAFRMWISPIRGVDPVTTCSKYNVHIDSMYLNPFTSAWERIPIPPNHRIWEMIGVYHAPDAFPFGIENPMTRLEPPEIRGELVYREDLVGGLDE